MFAQDATSLDRAGSATADQCNLGASLLRKRLAALLSVLVICSMALALWPAPVLAEHHEGCAYDHTVVVYEVYCGGCAGNPYGYIDHVYEYWYDVYQCTDGHEHWHLIFSDDYCAIASVCEPRPRRGRKKEES